MLCTPFLLLCLLHFSSTTQPIAFAENSSAAHSIERNRSPVDLVFSPDHRWLFTANQTSATVSVVNVETGDVVQEIECGQQPSALTLTPDAKQLLVTGTWEGDLSIYNVELPTDKNGKAKLGQRRSLSLRFQPRGVVVSPDSKTAYVALETQGTIAVVDLDKLTEVDRIEVGNWPRYLALTSDGKRLAVGLSGDGGIAVVDTTTRKKLFDTTFTGINIGHLQISKDDQFVYFPWMIYRLNPITPNNIRIGWVLASRLGRVRLDKKERREALELDKRGEAVADPHGFALSPDEKWMISAASGSQELLVLRAESIPWLKRGGRDHIPADLVSNPNRFYRIHLGGRPMAVRFHSDGKRAFVANYVLNSIQEVDLEQRKITRSIELGGPEKPSPERLGEAIFYDGKRSLDQWYSCHTCHYEGHTNSIIVDTLNDGRSRNYKTILSLRNVSETGPWTWHGWQKDLKAAMRKSLRDTMLTQKKITEEDVAHLIAYLKTLKSPPGSYLERDGSLSKEAQRGQAVFQSKKAGCATCHRGPHFTDGRIREVGTGARSDYYKGYNTPSLLGVSGRLLLLHDGRASSLEEVLTKHHNPKDVTGVGELSDQELSDLIAYLKSL